MIGFFSSGDANKQVLKLEPLLSDAEKLEPEMMQKMKKENHIARERRAPKTDTARNAAYAEETASPPTTPSGSSHPSKVDIQKPHISKTQKL